MWTPACKGLYYQAAFFDCCTLKLFEQVTATARIMYCSRCVFALNVSYGREDPAEDSSDVWGQPCAL